jgi:hypothetical protein
MRQIAVVALVALIGCKHKADTEAVHAPSGPPRLVICPEGTAAAGAEPPTGVDSYCTVTGSDRIPVKQGPSQTWHPGGTPASRGDWDRGKQSGEWKSWYPNGQLESTGSYAMGDRIGHWTEWWPSGQKKSEGDYPDGMWTYWHENGQVQTTGAMVHGQKDGLWVDYDPTGKAVRERTWKDGRLVTMKELGG